MRHPPPRSRRPFYAPTSAQMSDWLRNLGVLLFGVGIGIIGVDWLRTQPNASPPSPTYAPDSARSPGSSRLSESELSESELSESNRSNQETRRSGSQRITLADEVADATVCVRGVMPDGEQVCASGVSIDPELAGIDPKDGSVVVTNFHVVLNTGNRPPILLGGQGEVFISEVIRQSPEMDLALLLVPEAKFPVALLAESSPQQGIAVRAIGFPNNRPLTVQNSTLLGLTQDCLAVPPCLAIQQGTITHGNSGGPLEADGQVIGITQGETLEEIAIPVEQIRQFLAGEVPSFNNGLPPNYPGFPRRPPRFPPPPFGGPPPYGW